MPRTLIRKNPSNFKTLPLFVEATPEGLSYQSVGMPLNFSHTLQRRRPVTLQRLGEIERHPDALITQAFGSRFDE